MKLKTRAALSGFLGVCAIVCAASAAALAGGVPPAEPVRQPQSAVSAGKAEQTETGGYLLREYDGYIAVFTDENEKTPAAVTDIEVRTLPVMDREMLSDGIPVGSRQDLMALLEDMGS